MLDLLGLLGLPGLLGLLAKMVQTGPLTKLITIIRHRSFFAFDEYAVYWDIPKCRDTPMGRHTGLDARPGGSERRLREFACGRRPDNH